ncbi:peptidase M35 [Lysobacter helvus]|uniref:Peptidase M35 n=2 Tax=Lysobacteraceae TaxID=32033 RepID=A0ABM7Q7S2_9GAMM|nr:MULTISPECIES: M35 family metallo-endopeptidase [Lysobacter]BCT93437.1 peptidase M35 [Lysobacter caseinilyticus]BCT96590.1 peptidase M35 [Lysobacter helvus]
MTLSVRHTVAATAILAGAIAAAVAAPPSARTNPLQVSLVGLGNGVFEVAVTNTSRHTVRVPAWELPSALAESKLFSVSRDGKPVQYEGPLVKRALPSSADFAILRAGETRTARVDLGDAYDLSASGDYTVAFDSPLQHASLSTGEMLRQGSGAPMIAKSVPVRMWIDGGDRLGKNTNAAKGKPGGGGTTVVNGVSFVGCSSTQITGAGDAVVQARVYSENAKGYLNTGTVGPRYTTWFGAYTSTRYNTAKSHFTSIDAALDQSGGQIKINCGCNQSYYAYVYPTRPYEIFVCRAFWSAPLTGTDSKAGTLIHETSHFNVTAGTDDHVYGQSGAKSLALSDPDSALDNADSHEYFAENNPHQN